MARVGDERLRLVPLRDPPGLREDHAVGDLAQGVAGIFDRLHFGVTRPAALISPCSARGECLVTPGAGNSGDGGVALRLEFDERREDLFAADDYDADAIRRAASGQTPKIISLS